MLAKYQVFYTDNKNQDRIETAILNPTIIKSQRLILFKEFIEKKKKKFVKAILHKVSPNKKNKMQVFMYRGDVAALC